MTMFEITPLETPIDAASLIIHPLKVCNINHHSAFQKSMTRIPISEAVYEMKKQNYEESIQKTILSRDVEENSKNVTECHIFSYQFNQNFFPLSLPNISTNAFHPLFEVNHHYPPSWFCDIPSATFEKESKIYLAETMNPSLKPAKFKCEFCGGDCKFPYFASLNHKICHHCAKKAHFPGFTTSFDYFCIDKPDDFSGSLWTLENLNTLLETVEEVGDDWIECGKRLNKTPAECLSQFLRLPMYDRYYVADPLSVPPGEIPNDSSKYPFMIAPDPIATFVEFMHMLSPSIGNTVADVAQKEIENILSTKQGTIPFAQVGPIVQKLLQKTKTEAGDLSLKRTAEMIEEMTEIAQILENDFTQKFSELESSLKFFQNHPNSHNHA